MKSTDTDKLHRSARGRPSGGLQAGVNNNGAPAPRPDALKSNPRRARAAGREATLTVRPANRSDFEPLSFFFDTALRRDYFLRRGQLKEILSDNCHRVYVAEIDAVLVGAAITSAGKRLVNALVHPGYRGLGIGRALMDYNGASEVRAKLDMNTGDPRGFYKSMGFSSTGERSAAGNIEVMRRKEQPHAGSNGTNGSRRRSPERPAARSESAKSSSSRRK